MDHQGGEKGQDKKEGENDLTKGLQGNKGGEENIDYKETELTEKKPSRKELKKIKDERRENWRLKKAKWIKNKRSRERRKKEQEKEMVRKGNEKTMSQHTLRRWAISGGRLEGAPEEGAKGGNPPRKRRTRGEKKGIG